MQKCVVHYPKLPAGHATALKESLSKFHNIMAMFWLHRDTMIKSDEILEVYDVINTARFREQVISMAVSIVDLHRVAKYVTFFALHSSSSD